MVEPFNGSNEILRIKIDIDFSKEAKEWIKASFGEKRYNNIQNNFFVENKSLWVDLLVNSNEPIFHTYFKSRGLSNELIPKFTVIEVYKGSLIIIAGLVFEGMVGGYAIVKGISEIPDMIKSINELIDMCEAVYKNIVNKEAKKQLLDMKMNENANSNVSSMPDNVVNVKFTPAISPQFINPSPILAAQKVEFNIAITEEYFVFENLDDTPLTNVKITVAKEEKRDSYTPYTCEIPFISPHQTVIKNVSEFSHEQSKPQLSFDKNRGLTYLCQIQYYNGNYTLAYKI